MAGKVDRVYEGVYRPFLNPKRTAGTGQQRIQWMLERTLIELAMNRFKWEGLPEEIDVRWLEMSIMFHGLSVFYFDPDYDRFLALPGAGTGQLNLLGNPVEFIVYGNQMYTKTLKGTDVVPIWGNYTRVPDIDKIQIYAARIAAMDRTIEINADNARRTKIMTFTENGRATAQNVNRQISEGAAAIAVAQGYDIQQVIGNIDLGVDPQAIVNMHILRSREWAEAMTLFGINNANQDKKERLVAAEVSGNDDMVELFRMTALNARKQACEQIKRMWPSLNPTVEYSTDMNQTVMKDTSTPKAVQQGASE